MEKEYREKIEKYLANPYAPKAITSIRKNQGITQNQVADDLGISQNSYSRIERGETKLTYDRICQICGSLSIELDLIFKVIEEFEGIEIKPNEDYKSMYFELDREHKQLLSYYKEVQEMKKILEVVIDDKEKIINLLEEKVDSLEKQLKR